MNREIIFYETENGKIPVKDFLDKLDLPVVKKIAWTFQLLLEHKIVPKTYFKKLEATNGMWEIRINFHSNAYRIFSFWDKDNLIVLTHGIIKKSQKTPTREIKQAETYKKDYFRREK